jgi:hypothetical protein
MCEGLACLSISKFIHADLSSLTYLLGDANNMAFVKSLSTPISSIVIHKPVIRHRAVIEGIRPHRTIGIKSALLRADDSTSQETAVSSWDIDSILLSNRINTDIAPRIDYLQVNQTDIDFSNGLS